MAAGKMWGSGTAFNDGSSCLPCNENTYRTIFNASCLPASPGYYVDPKDQTVQKPCPAGRMESQSGCCLCGEITAGKG